jgi:DNA-binding cell septation regulator SpoVG
MKIAAKILKTNLSEKVKATADITLDDAVTIREARLVENDKGRFVVFPKREWYDKDGNIQRSDIVHIEDSDLKNDIRKAVEKSLQTFTQNSARTSSQAYAGPTM